MHYTLDSLQGTHTPTHTERLAIKLAVCASVTKFENARNPLLVLFDSRREIVADSLRFKDQNFETNFARIPGVNFNVNTVENAANKLGYIDRYIERSKSEKG